MAYTTINKSSEHFNTKLYTGNGGTQTISGIGFKPDFTWVKGRNHAYYHYLQDAVRGSTNVLYTNNNDAQATGVTAGISAWNSDGYITGSQGALNYNGRTFVAWNWKANGAGSSNTDGDITSTVSANTTSGFSIVKWTGNGSNDQRIGHGLGVRPVCWIVKRTDTSANWYMMHQGLASNWYDDYFLNLNANGARLGDNNVGTGNPTSTTFYVGDDAMSNASGGTYIAYVFAEKQGYSKFSSYLGNGNANGAFVYTGFKPAFVMIKNATTANTSWTMCDNKRAGYNASNYRLAPNLTDVESTSNAWEMYSNGFKMTSTGSRVNTSSDNYIYLAFAEAPLVGTNNIPCTAR